MLSHEELVRVLNENRSIEVIIDAEIFSDSGISLKKLCTECNRKHRNAREYKYSPDGRAFFNDKIVFDPCI